ncbi:MAG: STAS domain-containing protein [Solirubrobacterales bacterium]|nr:STAS domain-containing protein [Solirubrobacterales bacterium]
MPPATLLTRPAPTRPSPPAVPVPFSCEWTDGGAGAAWVKPSGELDLFTAPQLDAALRAAQAAAPRVVLDLRGVEFFDSAAFHVIVEASIRARESAGCLVGVRGPEQVQRALSLIGIPESVEIVALHPTHPPVQALLELARTEATV